MAASQQSSIRYDSLFSFEAGMNMGIAPMLLPKNQLAFAQNVTVRSTFINPRPTFRKIALTYGGDAALQSNFEGGKWQGGAYFKPDNSDGTLCAAISGRLFQVAITGTTGVVAERAPAAGPVYPKPSTQRQAWLWQAEKWLIWNDGLTIPFFLDGTTTVASNYGAAVPFSTTTTAPFTIPAIAATVLAVPFTATAPNLVVGDIVTVQFRGTFQVLAIVGLNVDLLNLTAAPDGYVVATGTTVSWQHIGTQLPPGRMGVYGMGRNWVSLIDGKQFVASDLVGGSSGTVGNNYRDAVLQITENLFLAGGGNFTVPGNPGDIKAMKFAATLDASLGQGPLQVVTPHNVFSCNAPVDRLTWQDMTNPILTESLIGSGGLSQNATIVVNSDLVFRGYDGIGSLILGRRDFHTWGNVPISAEVDPLLSRDSQSLLEFATGEDFDNRTFQSVSPVSSDQGVYWKGLVVINSDPISSLRGKAPSVYDGLWTGLNIFKLIVGEFAGIKRLFAFTLNTITGKIELWEIQRDNEAIYDNGDTRITWEFEVPVLDFGNKNAKQRQFLRLLDGEIHVDNLLGRVDFQVFYKADQWPCWVPWFSWSECAKAPDPTKPETANYQPQYRPRMGFGEPSPLPCDQTNNRPMREGYGFQVKIVITGHCRVVGLHFKTSEQPEPFFAKQSCERLCTPEEEAALAAAAAATQPVVSFGRLLDAIEAITLNDGTVVPIILGNKAMSNCGQLGRIPGLLDGKYYDLQTATLNDGTVAPIVDQTPHNTPVVVGPTGIPCSQYGRVHNQTDGKYYDLKTVTLDDGTVVPICDQTPHNTPTGP